MRESPPGGRGRLKSTLFLFLIHCVYGLAMLFVIGEIHVGSTSVASLLMIRRDRLAEWL